MLVSDNSNINNISSQLFLLLSDYMQVPAQHFAYVISVNPHDNSKQALLFIRKLGLRAVRYLTVQSPTASKQFSHTSEP